MPAWCRIMCAGVGNFIGDGALELRRQRQHGAKHFSKGGKVVVGNPFAETEQLLIEHRRLVQDPQDIFGLH